MNDVRAFSSFEEAQAYMADQERLANENVLPINREVGYGDGSDGSTTRFWWRYLADYDLFIFGEVFPADYTVKWYAQTYKDMDEELTQERDYEIERLKSAHERGYRYGRCYSVVEPDGELGSTHMIEQFPMSEAEFNRAKAEGWDVRDSETAQLKPWFAVIYLRTRERYLKETS